MKTHCIRGHELTAENTRIRIRPKWTEVTCKECTRVAAAKRYEKRLAAMPPVVSLPGEEWRPIPGWPTYEVSSLGRVRSKGRSGRRAGLLTPGVINGYLAVLLYRDDGPRRSRHIHRLVLLAFAGEPPEGRPQAAHNDGNKLNNVIENLRWASPSENTEDARKHGHMKVGSKRYNAKLTEAVVLAMKEMWASGESIREIARKVGVSRPAVRMALNGITWRHVPDPIGYPAHPSRVQVTL